MTRTCRIPSESSCAGWLAALAGRLRLPFAVMIALAVCFSTWSSAAEASSKLERISAIEPLLPAAHPWPSPLELPSELDDLEQQVLLDGADGRWDRFSFLEAALVAGGVTDEDGVTRYRREFERHVDRLTARGVGDLPPRRRAEAIFEYLHREMLTGGYRLEASSPAEVIDSGRFNCVSGSAAYRYLAESLGLLVTNIQLPSHAYCRVEIPEGALVVETTCRRWFDMIGRKDSAEVWYSLRSEWTRVAGGPIDEDAQARAVSPVELVGTIYYNRGVDLLLAHRYEEAAAANQKSLWLDPANRTARENLLATLNNWAIAQANDREFDQAVKLLEDGLAIERTYQPLVANYVQLHRRWIGRLCRLGQFDRARQIVAHAETVLPESDAWGELEKAIARRQRETE